MNRHEAMVTGRTTYDATNPCKYGHIGKRYVSSGACVGCYEVRREAVKLNRMSERQTTRDWSPSAIPVRLAEPIDPRTIRAMNAVIPQFAQAILAGAKLALGDGDIALLVRNVQLAVQLTKRGKTPEQVIEALRGAI